MNAAQILTWLVLGVAASLYLITRFYKAFFGECAACEAAKIQERPKKTPDSPKADSPKELEPESSIPDESQIIEGDD